MNNVYQGGTRDNYEMLQIISTLTKKIDTLEKTVTELKANVRKRYTKKDTLKALNDIDKGLTPFIGFTGFITEIAKTSMDFEIIENQDMSIHSLFIAAITNTCSHLETRYPSEHTEYVNTPLPIVSFSQHKNVFFIYGNQLSDKWEVMDASTYQRMIQSVHMYLISRCSLWREKYLPARDLVADQDLGVNAYCLKRKQQSGYSWCRDRFVEPVINNGPDTERELTTRSESVKKYHKLMDKICNINVSTTTFSNKIKAEMYNLFSEYDSSQEYFMRNIDTCRIDNRR